MNTTWIGTKPEACQLCGKQFAAQFVDGKTDKGPWGLMCVPCHYVHGRGLGIGKGQLYQLNRKTAEWVLIAGTES